MYKLSIRLFSLLVLFVSIGCGNSIESSTIKPEDVRKSIENTTIPPIKIGEIVDNVLCDNSLDNSYSLYLPKNYTDSNIFAILFLFDAHASGNLPLEKYKSLADEFGIILAGSNSSKNGQSLSEQNNISSKFIESVISNYKIDPSKMFVGGFSGGARVAAQVASMNNKISGVIGCGAGLPNREMISNINFNYFMIAGNKDFNYLELKMLSNELKNLKSNSYFMEFDGIHEWPPLKVMKEAIYFQLLNAAKSDKSSVKSNLVQNYISYESSELQKAKINKDLVAQTNIYERITVFLKNYSNNEKYKNKYNELINSPVYKTHNKNNEKFMQIESGLQTELSSNFVNKDKQWWNNKVDQIVNSSRTANTNEEKLMNARILNYLSLLSFMYSDNLIKNNRLDEAQKYLFIYEKVDPENTEVYYLKAICYAKQNKNDLALLSLETAVKKGFVDFDRIKKETNFHFSDIELELIKKAKN